MTCGSSRERECPDPASQGRRPGPFMSVGSRRMVDGDVSTQDLLEGIGLGVLIVLLIVIRALTS